jgi:hypothetical protein
LQLNNRRSSAEAVLAAYQKTPTDPGLRDGLALGQIIRQTQITQSMIEMYPAEDFEVYDWYVSARVRHDRTASIDALLSRMRCG